MWKVRETWKKGGQEKLGNVFLNLCPNSCETLLICQSQGTVFLNVDYHEIEKAVIFIS